MLRNAARREGAPATPFGKRLRARFARIGLDADIVELRGQPARPAGLSS